MNSLAIAYDTAAIVLPNLAWQWHRYKTRFQIKAVTQKSMKGVNIIIERRRGFKWPTDDYRRCKISGHKGYSESFIASRRWFCFDQILLEEDDYDEKTIRVVVEAKEMVKNWKTYEHDAIKLQRAAQKAISR